ncbi:protein tyrosine phosphatase-like protein, PTPLA domain-containing protein [Phthorimaea operculella]|nr:protein tyrosine phosphatase-like protein, PTPLA domain-containing protein [Phthorimaea operculella]
MGVRYAKLEYDSVADTYEHVGSAIKFLQLMQYLEVMHPLFGYTKVSVFSSFKFHHSCLPEDMKKVYLIIYNLFQLIGYLYVLAVMGVRYAKLEYDSVADTYEHVGSAIKFLQLMQYLEVMHPLFGYTKVSVFSSFKFHHSCLPEDMKKVYLIIYNLFQLIGYLYVLAVMGVRYAKLEYDSVADTYEHVGSAIKFLQLMQYLEVMHPLFGYTKVSGFSTKDMKKVYLIIYKLFQLIGYLYVLAVMGVRYAKLEYDSVADTYEHVGSAIKFLQLMQYLEVMHPLFGYTKVSVFSSFKFHHSCLPEDMKKVYLIIYNLFQLIGYLYVLAVMGVRYAKLEYDSVADTYEHVGSAIKFLQLMQYLEVMHPLFGYTKVSGFSTSKRVLEWRPRLSCLPEDMKKVYLIIYKLFQLIGYLYVLAVMGVRYAKLEYDSVADTYEHVGSAIKFLQLMQYLEVMHPLFGYTKWTVVTVVVILRVRKSTAFLSRDEPAHETEQLRLLLSALEGLQYRVYQKNALTIRDKKEISQNVLSVSGIIYKLFQLIGYLYVLAVMGVRYAKLEYDSVADTYEHVGSAIKFLQLMQYLEVMHPLFGYTKGGALVPFLQVSGRAFVLFAMIEAEPRMQTKPVVFYLFLVWSMIEVVRYPYYISQLYKKEIYILTWLRYSMWIPLYPLGILCESIIILRNIPYFEETQRFTISLPNEWNFAFHLPTFLRVYLLILTFPGMYLVMGHMRKLRISKLKPKVKVIKKTK